jgi:hypothetical protein
MANPLDIETLQVALPLLFSPAATEAGAWAPQRVSPAPPPAVRCAC